YFRAEDGLRDGHVTGVQTCALPICSLRSVSIRCCNVTIIIVQSQLTQAGGRRKSRRNTIQTVATRRIRYTKTQTHPHPGPLPSRSEERRVGKASARSGGTVVVSAIG